jgi:hypothetical protein
MALAERKDCKDFIGIYYLNDFEIVSHFNVNSYDLQDIQWTKDDLSIVIYDSVLECKFLVYSPTGSLIAVHEPYNNCLGIKSYSLSPNSHYLSIGYYDNSLRLYNHLTWNEIYSFEHTPQLKECEKIVIFI